MMDFETARANMVDSQLRTTDVTSHSVLKAFLSVPREAFVPAGVRQIAYADEDLQICPALDGRPARYVMKASPLAKLLQLAAVSKDDVVLEVGGGSGYAAAILSQLAGSVVSLESDEALAAQATETLASLGYDNVAVVTGDLAKGYASEAPYDLIFINGSVEEVPAALTDQLRDGGRLVVVVGYGNAAKATVYRRDGNSTSAASFFNASVKPVPGFAKAAEFVF
ncbi:protein-L-isoaspartate O-methyltransferase [Agrobacterium tumefaciens]|uniref:Protein-L-isoaspartate O-methyltransferase n=1 Tax=Agrobacterium fabrum (strain C58 / ATCC 33970) TaxID=176299 RepID=A9CIQ4_AGRFC|nr:protein-L-isoaspartate O-methyltransferase [Agrobacterium fabrum]KEY50499.1 protein-L-isoaspartate O-methyltransferase [Agrobacterium tumefaciens]AAK87493.1 protein-L-isoaspartate O-methyltransferase [Agrobacterium fabrum str. C58]MCX2876167.1 protein-L-isoaspartate O-methyltransferase [Agrobacterium fabrum]NMV71615.1 protein-L-isoaspartate O-methyltransferase [Agrobacterium fabrum]QQN07009.1 protein-L-isoaspartate O-methyltransferase [Agrobacterium fabrum]